MKVMVGKEGNLPNRPGYTLDENAVYMTEEQIPVVYRQGNEENLIGVARNLERADDGLWMDIDLFDGFKNPYENMKQYGVDWSMYCVIKQHSGDLLQKSNDHVIVHKAELKEIILMLSMSFRRT